MEIEYMSVDEIKKYLDSIEEWDKLERQEKIFLNGRGKKVTLQFCDPVRNYSQEVVCEISHKGHFNIDMCGAECTINYKDYEA